MLDLNEIPVAESTRKTYLNALANLDKWLRGRPVTDETLAGYLSYLFDRGKSPVCGNTAIAAARWRCDSEDKDDPRGKLCRRALKNFRRQVQPRPGTSDRVVLRGRGERLTGGGGGYCMGRL